MPSDEYLKMNEIFLPKTKTFIISYENANKNKTKCPKAVLSHGDFFLQATQLPVPFSKLAALKSVNSNVSTN